MLLCLCSSLFTVVGWLIHIQADETKQGKSKIIFTLQSLPKLTLIGFFFHPSQLSTKKTLGAVEL